MYTKISKRANEMWKENTGTVPQKRMLDEPIVKKVKRKKKPKKKKKV